MTILTSVLDLEAVEETLIITPLADLRELAFQQIEAEAKDVLELLETGAFRNVVLDFRSTDSFGSTALGFFAALGKQVQRCKGRMAICNVSEHEREILDVTRLSKLWPLCASREEALAVVRT
jgi:anti-anti-sigma factor